MATLQCLNFGKTFATRVFVRNCNQTSAKISPELIIDKLREEREGITVFGLNRPSVRNAFSRSLVDSLLDGIYNLEKDASTRVLILRSNVPDIFCAGADLKERVKMSNDEVRRFVSRLRQMMRNIEELPFPVIAAMDGTAMGGGLEMALACDIRIASEDIKMGLVETRLAIIPGAGGTQRLPRIISPALAKELIFTARVFTGKEAKGLGIVNHAVPQNDNKDAAFIKALSLAEEMLPNGPIALKMAKRAVDIGTQVPLKQAYEIEEDCYQGVINTEDRLEGLKAFNEKRKPRYIGQ